MSRRDHLRISDACHVLGISRSTLLAAEEAGLITAGRTPGGHRRFAREELERYLRTHGGSASDDPVAHRPDAGPGRERVATDLRIALRELVQLVDATDVVLRPRGGQAVTLPMLSDRTPLGVLFVVGRVGHELLPGELRIIAAAQRMLGLLVDRLQRLADLERRLSGVRDLAASS